MIKAPRQDRPANWRPPHSRPPAPLSAMLACLAAPAVLTALLAALTACQPAEPPEPPVSAAEYNTGKTLNPVHRGKLLYRGYGDHHPSCFTMSNDSAAPQTEDLDCPPGAATLLETCPAGKLHPRHDNTGCVCVPIDGPPSRVQCPR